MSGVIGIGTGIGTGNGMGMGGGLLWVLEQRNFSVLWSYGQRLEFLQINRIIS